MDGGELGRDAGAGRDAGRADAGEGGPCGEFGQPCCAGDACVEGACLERRCVAFGGAYALQGEDTNTCVGNPLAGGACACPVGFLAEALHDLDGDVDEGTGWETRIFHCRTPNVVPGADYLGGYGANLGEPPAGCAPGCVTNNGFSGGCGCPSPAVAESIPGVHYRRGTSLDCSREVALCRNPSTAPVTYGGFYRQQTSTTSACAEVPVSQRCVPNPVTGTCSCPSGFVGVTADVMRPHTEPARLAENWHCDATLTLCVLAP